MNVGKVIGEQRMSRTLGLAYDVAGASHNERQVCCSEGASVYFLPPLARRYQLCGVWTNVSASLLQLCATLASTVRRPVSTAVAPSLSPAISDLTYP